MASNQRRQKQKMDNKKERVKLMVTIDSKKSVKIIAMPEESSTAGRDLHDVMKTELDNRNQKRNVRLD